MERLYESSFDFEPSRRRARDGSAQPSSDALGVVGNRAASAVLAGGIDRHSRRTQGSGPLDPEIGAEIAAERGGGHPLDDDARADMEGHLGTDLSVVRIHDGPRADELSRSVQAEAFTTGTDVFFKSGKYQPTTSDGRRLLAHELTHVVQQSTGQTDGAGRVSHPDDSQEVEARAVGDSVASSTPFIGHEQEEESQTSPDANIHRQDEDEEEVQTSPDTTIHRQDEDEEEVQTSPDTTIHRQDKDEEEEEVQTSPDADVPLDEAAESGAAV